MMIFGVTHVLALLGRPVDAMDVSLLQVAWPKKKNLSSKTVAKMERRVAIIVKTFNCEPSDDLDAQPNDLRLLKSQSFVTRILCQETWQHMRRLLKLFKDKTAVSKLFACSGFVRRCTQKPFMATMMQFYHRYGSYATQRVFSTAGFCSRVSTGILRDLHATAQKYTFMDAVAMFSNGCFIKRVQSLWFKKLMIRHTAMFGKKILPRVYSCGSLVSRINDKPFRKSLELCCETYGPKFASVIFTESAKATLWDTGNLHCVALNVLLKTATIEFDVLWKAALRGSNDQILVAHAFLIALPSRLHGPWRAAVCR